MDQVRVWGSGSRCSGLEVSAKFAFFEVCCMPASGFQEVLCVWFGLRFQVSWFGVDVEDSAF